MTDEWFINKSGVKLGPFSNDEVLAFLLKGQISGKTKVWKKGLLQWEDLEIHFSDNEGPPPLTIENASTGEISKKAGNKLAAGLCGIFLGAFGIHKFILGFSTSVIIMLLVSIFTCVGFPIMYLIGLIEGIIYLCKSDEDFVKTYVEDKKEWF